MSRTCKAELSLDGKSITSGTTLSEAGGLQLKVTDEAGNIATATITLTRVDSSAPTITTRFSEKNVIAGVTATIKDNQLLFDNEVAASWTDDYTKTCKAELTLTSEGATTARTINSGDKLTEAGILKLTVTDDYKNAASSDIKLTAIAVYGLENMNNLTLKVDQEVNLLQGLTIAEGLTLSKVEIEIDGKRTNASDYEHFIPQYPGSCRIVFTLTNNDGESIVIESTALTILPLTYESMAVTDIRPVEDIFPFILQMQWFEGGNEYDYIEHLRLAEATRIVDMMWEYGAGNHSKAEYQALMGRLNTGMTGEVPL